MRRSRLLWVLLFGILMAVAAWPGKHGWLPCSLEAEAQSLQLIPLYLLSFGLFTGPGLLLARPLVRSQQIQPSSAVIVAIALSALIGYGMFWLYFLWPSIGRVISTLMMVSGTGFWLTEWQRSRRHQALTGLEDVRAPLTLMMLAGLGYFALTYAYDLPGTSERTQLYMRFMDWRLPDDPDLPYVLAEQLADGKDPRGTRRDWQSSDRPPLQAGVYLIQQPLGTIVPGGRWLHYHATGIALQTSWIAALWALFRMAGFSRRRVCLLLGFLFFSGFVFINTVFVWPKMFAGALAVLAVQLAFQGFGSRPWRCAGLFGMTAALSLLAHGGATFTLVCLAGLLLLPRYFPGVRRLAIAGVVSVLLVLPWLAYQRYYDPPGDRLIKMHLAGLQTDTRTPWQAIRDAYAARTMAQIAHHKWENLKVLFVEDVHVLFGAPHIARGGLEFLSASAWRRWEFHNLLASLGLLNLGWLVIACIAIRRRRVGRPLAFCLTRLLPFCMINLLVWVLLMFGPATTILHHGSYACFLLLAGGLAACLTWLPRVVRVAVLLIQCAGFFAVWIASSPARQAGQPHFLLLAVASICLLMLVSIALGKSPESLWSRQARSPIS